MTYKKFLLVIAIITLLTFLGSCSGSIEQPNFVSLYSSARSKNGEKNDASDKFNSSGLNPAIPELRTFDLQPENIVKLEFFGEVKKINVHALRNGSSELIPCYVESVDDKSSKSKDSADAKRYSYRVKPSVDFSVGEKFTIEGSVECSSNNALDFSLPFVGCNSKPAKLVFTELKVGSTTNFGFIRFKVVKGGNLSGLTLLMPANSKAKKYIFPVADVKKGEYIVYHWFIPPDVSVFDEVNNAQECNDSIAFSDARDFWGNFKKFNPKRTNAILLKSSEKGVMQDAVLFAHPSEDDWGKELISETAEEAVENALWYPGAEIDDSLKLNITPSKKIIRKNLSALKHSADDWVMVKAEKIPKKN